MKIPNPKYEHPEIEKIPSPGDFELSDIPKPFDLE